MTERWYRRWRDDLVAAQNKHNQAMFRALRQSAFTDQPTYSMTDKKQQYLDTAKALEALGDTSLAEACRAKAASLPEPPKENPWVTGGDGFYRYRVTSDGSAVEYTGAAKDDYISKTTNITPTQVRALAKQLGMIDTKDMQWGVRDGIGCAALFSESREEAASHGRSIGMANFHVFQHTAPERIK